MKRAAFAASCLLLCLLFTGLGVWQVERRAWKLDLIARVEARLYTTPVPPPSHWSDDLAYTRVRVTGAFLHDRETLVQALTVRGAGFWVLTPLRTREGTILVNRGFVPPQKSAALTRRAGLPIGTVTVTGLARKSEPGGGFLRANDPAANRWHSRDVAAIGRVRRLREVAPYFVDADATPNPGGYPVGGLTVVAFRNNHLLYVLTWFALAGLSLFGAVLTWRKER